MKPKLKAGEVHVVGLDRLYLTPNRESFQLGLLGLVVIQGIPDVQRAVIDTKEGKGGESETYRLLIEGKNLLRVMGTDGIDGTHTRSNDILEVEQTLGIEAARVMVRRPRHPASVICA